MTFVTLIPAYKPHFFPQALDCLESQALLPGRIIVSDDSPDGAVIAATRSWLEAKPDARIASIIECVVGPRQGTHANILSLLAHEHVQRSDFFHVFFDDDVLDRDFYGTHMEALSQHSGCLSVNKRRIVDHHGVIIDVNHYPDFINAARDATLRLDEPTAYSSTMPAMINWFGELTNCMFPEHCRHVLARMHFDDGICYYGLGDIGVVLEMSQAGRVVFVNRYLSGFRQSGVHTTAQRTSNVCVASVWAWWAIAIHARRTRRVSRIDYERFLGAFRPAVRKLGGGPAADGMRRAFARHGRDLPAAEADFLAAWRAFLESFPEGRHALRAPQAATGRTAGSAGERRAAAG